MKTQETFHFSYHKEHEGGIDLYQLAPGVGICFNQIYTDSWTKGDSSLFSERMLILNFCLEGRCEVSLAKNRHTIVRENQVCVSTILPTRDFYYPGRSYEGIQIYIDRDLYDPNPADAAGASQDLNGEDFLSQMGIDAAALTDSFCKTDGVYLHPMSDGLAAAVKDAWELRKQPEAGLLRYVTVRMLHELAAMPRESRPDTYFTRSQIAIVKEAEKLIMQDLSRRITAKEMAARFGISESSFKLYVKGVLGDSYLAYFRKKRMEQAAGLLADTDLKVIEIAGRVGYENQGKFAKVFADLYGVTPLEYRRLAKGNCGKFEAHIEK